VLGARAGADGTRGGRHALLDTALRARNVTSLVVTGTMTDICGRAKEVVDQISGW